MRSNLAVDLRPTQPPAELDVGHGQRVEFRRSGALINGVEATKADALAAVVQAYRARPTPIWAALLLDLLAPSIVHRLQHLNPQPPVLEADDMRQELLHCVLYAAASMPIPSNPRNVRNALIKRANLMFSRRLDRELRHQRWHRSLEALEERSR